MADNQFLTYKNKPLVRKGKEIYYGDMSEKYVVRLEILSEKEEGGKKLPERVLVQLLLSDTEIPVKDRIKKKSEKVLASAKEKGAEEIITACPLCLYNLRKNGGEELPVKYFTELLAEALGVGV